MLLHYTLKKLQAEKEALEAEKAQAENSVQVEEQKKEKSPTPKRKTILKSR